LLLNGTPVGADHLSGLSINTVAAHAFDSWLKPAP
jgi:hypothetical protein